MTENKTLTLDEAMTLALTVLTANGFSEGHARSIARTVYAGQRDECHSHGLYRLLMCVATVRANLVDGAAVPEVVDQAPGVVRVDAKRGFSPLALEAGRPLLIEKARKSGIAAMAINNCFHFSALWPEVEDFANDGLAAMAMNPSHSWVAPAGGTRGTLGTNPIAFAWPRPGKHPFVFDFATSAVARGEIELHRRAGKPLPEGVAIDADGKPTTDPAAAMAGAMLTFGGHKGSALSIMIELLAGPLISDLTSIESQEIDKGANATPLHGELIIAFDTKLFGGNNTADNAARAEKLFDAIVEQGARLPSQRRYEARERTMASGTVTIPAKLYEDILALMP